MLQSICWNNRSEVAQVYFLLQKWRPLSPEAALELLDHQYADIQVLCYIHVIIYGSGRMCVCCRCGIGQWSGWSVWVTTSSQCTCCSWCRPSNMSLTWTVPWANFCCAGPYKTRSLVISYFGTCGELHL